MSITQREKTLFAAWAKRLEKESLYFVEDGVVCEDAYAKSDPKILFVLKEPHRDNGGDIRNSMPGGGHTWKRITRWAYGIQHRTSLPKWDEVDAHCCNSQEQIEATLQNVCAMNLKKSPGGNSVIYKEMKAFIEQYKTELQTQYDIYNPDLTICCGQHVSDWVRNTMEHNGDWKTTNTTNSSVWWYQRSENKYVIDYKHPASPHSIRPVFYDLVDALNEIYGNA